MKLSKGLALLVFIAMVAACSDKSGPVPSFNSSPVPAKVAEQADAQQVDSEAADTPQALAAQYSGAKKCLNCHQQEHEQWRGSHHDLAMQEANADTVLGHFNGQTVEHLGERFTFSQKAGKFYVRTNNIKGEQQTFEISHTFGLMPLQQYLIALDNGAYQALTMAWDSRSKDQGGQRWYHLYPDEPMPFTDSLHWTRLHQNWNFQCADCHSTNLHKQFDAETNSYNTVFDELNVACEACHGPASKHLEWAQDDQHGELKHSGFAASLLDSEVQIDTCARCHSRRRIIQEGFEPGKPLYDHYVPSLLEPGLYHADGQIDDEVYVYGSFKQSKMYQQGVKCSNCHNPHSATLRLEGNAVCTQCHTSTPPAQYAGLKAKNYDTSEHHFHDVGTKGAQCRSCHMPAKTYMGVDERYDHGFRVPRPQQSAAINAPDVCTSCHEDKSASWASKAIENHFGESRDEANSPVDGFGIAFHQARTGLAVNQALAAISSDKTQTPIVRASALVHMTYAPDLVALEAAQNQLRSKQPAIQLAALRVLENVPINERWNMVLPLLSDKHLAVRAEAALIVADAPAQFLQDKDRKIFQAALNEFKQTQLLNADRPDALTNLASVSLRQGDTGTAEDYLRRAMKTDPSWVPAYLNLADLYRSSNRDAEAEALFKAALAQPADIAEVHHAYGLWLSRQGRQVEALDELGRAVELSGSWRYQYVYAIGLNSNGKSDLAVQVLKTALVQNPGNAELLFALATILRDQKRFSEALQYALQLATTNPNDPRVKGLVEQLSAQRVNAK